MTGPGRSAFHGGRLTLALIVAATAALASGCVIDVDYGLFIYNQTGGAVVVSYEHNGASVALTESVAAHGFYRVSDDPFKDTGHCSAGDLVARTPAGIEIARRHEQICGGASWVVALPSPTPGEPEPVAS